MITSRQIFLLIFLVCAVLLGFGFYLQYVEGLDPCILCMIQRVFFILVGVTALMGFLHNPAAAGIRIYASFTALFAACGAGIAGRQIWLQHLPPEKVPECGGDLFFLLEVYPLGEAILNALKGTGDCAEVVWTFLGFSIPEWAFVLFLGIFLISLYILFRPRKAE